ncbi:MAG: hypothetical protein WA921_05160, partial [Ahrensia sp.]
EIARLENLSIAPGTARSLGPSGTLAAGAANQMIRQQVIAAKVRLSNAETEKVRTEADLTNVQHQINKHEENIGNARDQRRALGCA